MGVSTLSEPHFDRTRSNSRFEVAVPVGWRQTALSAPLDCRSDWGESLTTTAPSNSAALTPDTGGDPDSVYLGLRLETWLKVGTIGALFCLLFWPNLRR